MTARLRRLPGIRSRSNVELGVYCAVLVVLGFVTVFTLFCSRVVRNAPTELLVALIGLGGAVFIAYSVGISSLFRQIRRDPSIEHLLGFLTGLGICGVFGIAFALMLLDVHRPYGRFEVFGFWWAAYSQAFLAGFIAALPLFAYEDARIKHLNHED